MGEWSDSVGIGQPRVRRAAGWMFSTVAGGLTNTTAVQAVAGKAGVRQGVRALDYINTSDTASEFVILSGATVIYRGYAPANMTSPVALTGISAEPLFGNAGDALSIQMVTTATATRFNMRGNGYDG